MLVGFQIKFWRYIGGESKENNNNKALSHSFVPWTLADFFLILKDSWSFEWDI